MNGADVLRSENVGEKRWNGREPTTIHRKYNEQARFEDRPLPAGRKTGDQQKQDELDDEKDRVGVPTAEVIGSGSPKEAAPGVENADQGYQNRRLNGSFLKKVLGHGRGLCQNADSSSDVDEQNSPEKIELDGAERGIARDAAIRDHLVRLREWNPTPRRP